MSYETLMVQLELGRSNKAPLGVVRDLAKRMGAVVNGVAAAQPIQTAVAAEGFYGGDLVLEDTKELEAEAKVAENEFHAVLNGGEIGRDWTLSVTPFPLSERIAGAAANADLMVVGVAQNGEGNAWGWLNSITEAVDHHARAKSDARKLDSILFGAGEKLKAKALGEALELVV